MTYQLVSGIVSQLRIHNGTADLAFPIGPGPSAETAARLESQSESASSSEGRFHITLDTEVATRFFVCRVGADEISGSFHEVEFRDGDKIDFAVKNEEGKLVAMAARDPVKQLIWVQLYMTRGHLAQRRHYLRWGALLSIVLPMMIAAFETYSAIRSQGYFDWLGVFTGIGLIIMLGSINFLVCRRFYSASYEATEVFKALGYADPANVNLPKGESFWAGLKGITGDNWVASEPWRYRC